MRTRVTRKGSLVLRSIRDGCAPLFATLLFAATLTDCRNTALSLHQPPVDADSARVMAASVARLSGCAGFEDYDLTATGHWDFSCQVGSEMFLLRAVAGDSERAARIAQLKAANQPFEAGPSCLVWEFDTPGQHSDAAHLARFRDALR